MAIYTYPLNSTTPVTIAAGADFATETTLALVKTGIDAINTQVTDFDRNSGAAGANTLRSVLATRHEAVGTPISVRLGDGTDFLTCGAIAAAQKTVTTATKALDTVSLLLGWDGTTHRELLVDTNGGVKIASADIALIGKPEYARAFAPVIHNFASTGITASAYTQIIASTSAKAIRLLVTNSSAGYIQIATGAAAFEVDFAVIPPSGAIAVDITVSASTRISVTCDQNIITGKLTISAFV